MPVPRWRRSDWARVAVVVLGIMLVTVGHYFTPPSLFLWHNVFQRLYYLPIIFAALSFGLRGGLAAALCSSLAYLPHIIMTWRGSPDYSISQYGEIAVFFLVGAVTGILAGRERKQRDELQRSAEQLSKVYRELQDSVEQVKRADRLSAIGQLSASLAHEIRNPLASLEGAIDILEREPESEELRQEFLGIMRKECRRLSRLLTNLLDFARPRRPQLQKVDVGRLVESVANLARPAAERSGVALKMEIAKGIPFIECDAEQIQQVVLNLTLNAIQSMPEGGTARIGVRGQDSGVLLEVRDEGCGVAEDFLDRIFDPFYTTKEQGTGLGLSVAHQIVSQHGGMIKVQRNAERGMMFTVCLPIRYGARSA
jgi:two-component system sensor histidine kinase HydH